ncbi:MAG: hypothetical protein ABIC95_00025 [archaeon]
MAKTSLRRLDELPAEKYPSNTLTDYYDITHKLLEAVSLNRGIKTSGEGAHKELIDWVTKESGLGEGVRQSLQKLREYRNRIAYEGFMVKSDYIIRNKKKMREIISSLFVLLEKDQDKSSQSVG